MTMPAHIVVQITAISKRFGGVHALRAVEHGTRKPDQRMFPQGSNFWFGIPSSAEW